MHTHKSTSHEVRVVVVVDVVVVAITSVLYLRLFLSIFTQAQAFFMASLFSFRLDLFAKNTFYYKSL